MKVTLESTAKIVQLIINGVNVPARVWEGETAQDVACHAYITRIAIARDEDVVQFQRELQEQRAPSAALDVIPNRLVI